MMDMYSFMLGSKSGGGGSSITVESLSVTENGTTTAPTGKAYSPVVVNVPNSYSAGDEGKVVSNGALVSQTSDTVTQNGTVDTTLINSLLVNVASGGGGLVSESGTWTPSADTDADTITFANSHTKLPVLCVVFDNTNTSVTPNETVLAFQFIDYTNISTDGISRADTSKIYATINQLVLSSNSSTSNITRNCSKKSSLALASSEAYPRYWVTPTQINLHGLNYYFRADRTYKWLAIWPPES